MFVFPSWGDDNEPRGGGTEWLREDGGVFVFIADS